ncbi:glycosyltransferase family 4 protein [Chloroflexota bacterium]
MKVLFISNFYPPADDGWGYMQLCEEVADGLHTRGHEVAIMTSTRIAGPEIHREYPVYRYLSISPDFDSKRSIPSQFFISRRKKEKLAMNDFKRIVDEHQPDIVFIWHAIGLPKTLFKEAEYSKQHEVVYYLADYQPEIGNEYINYWRGKPANPVIRGLKEILSKFAQEMLENEGKPIRLSYQHAICVSEYVRNRLVTGGYIPSSAVVIHNGVDLSEFKAPGKDQAIASSDGLRCLVAGRIIPNKGIHTVVDAFAMLDIDSLPSKIGVTILGDGPVNYLNLIKDKIAQNNLQEQIQIKLPVPRSQMPEILANHNVLILPSEYDEPLARSIQEGMAMGLLVIGTTTGGSGELLVHKRTGLVFNPGDSESLAEQIVFAAQHPNLVKKFQFAGRQEIEQHFNIQRTVLEIEAYLIKLLAGEKLEQN